MLTHKIFSKIIPFYNCFNRTDCDRTDYNNLYTNINNSQSNNYLFKIKQFVYTSLNSTIQYQTLMLEQQQKETQIIKFMKTSISHHKLLFYYINNYSKHICNKCKNMKYSLFIDMFGYKISTNTINIFIEYLQKIPINSDIYNLNNVLYRCCRYNITIFSTYNLAIIYLERFFNNCNIQIANLLNQYNFYIFFIVSLTIAIKYNDDQPYNSYSLSYISGIPLNILNKFEILFLQIIDYNLYYKINEFEHIHKIIEFEKIEN